MDRSASIDAAAGFQLLWLQRQVPQKPHRSMRSEESLIGRPQDAL